LHRQNALLRQLYPADTPVEYGARAKVGLRDHPQGVEDDVQRALPREDADVKEAVVDVGARGHLRHAGVVAGVAH